MWRYEGSLWVAPFGLVGGTVVLTFRECSGSHRWIVEAFAPDTPGGAAYIVRRKRRKRRRCKRACMLGRYTCCRCGYGFIAIQ